MNDGFSPSTGRGDISHDPTANTFIGSVVPLRLRAMCERERDPAVPRSGIVLCRFPHSHNDVAMQQSGLATDFLPAETMHQQIPSPDAYRHREHDVLELLRGDRARVWDWDMDVRDFRSSLNGLFPAE